jgi:Tfp pilus assembly protein PilO
VNKEKKTWIGVLGGGALATGLAGWGISAEMDNIELKRQEIETLRATVASSHKLIEGTSSLEREVIVQREMSTVIRNILPDNAEMNNWTRTIQGFTQDSGVRITGLKAKTSPKRAKDDKTDFREVTTAFTIDSDAFQLLEFFSLVETHHRFMRVPSFQITAAKRQSVEESGFASHRVSVDIQTFVYEPDSESSIVKIEGYDRKRDLMVGEINRRRQDLELQSFTYRGARGRRDPFVDPRVPVEGGSVLSVPEQMEIVQNLVEQIEEADTIWTKVRDSQNVIEEMMASAELEESLAYLEEEVRRVEAEGAITYLPSHRRLQIEVIDAMTELRDGMGGIITTVGPSVERLREVLQAMNRHFDREEYSLAIDAFRLVDDQLAYIESDPLRKPFIDRLRKKAMVARIVRDFEQIEILVGGVAIMEGVPAVALINGQSLSVGDMLDNNLFINAIRTDEIEFIYRGVVLARRF